MTRRIDLERAIAEIKPHPRPKVHLEQYTISPAAAAEILQIAAYVHDDILGKTVVDLGCGTGRLAIGAAMLGAREVIGVDIDPEAVKVAKENARAAGVIKRIQWVISDIEATIGTFDTAIMNPPFGTRVRHVDRLFLLKAIAIAKVIYSLHKRSTRQYLLRFINSKHGLVDSLFQMELEIPQIFNFHTRRKHIVEVDLYRILVAP